MKSFIRQTVLPAVSFLAVCRGGTCVSAIDCEPLRTASLSARRLLTTHCLKIKVHPRFRIALDAAIGLCAEHTVGRHRVPDFPALPGYFPTRLARGRIIYLARPRCGVRMCTDLECLPPTLEGQHRMTY